jgi:hypothetical protein
MKTPINIVKKPNKKTVIDLRGLEAISLETIAKRVIAAGGHVKILGAGPTVRREISARVDLIRGAK